MLVFGAIDFAAAVARVGKFLGYHVTVCDARKVFATASRFPDADEVVVDWPHRFLAATDGGRQDRHLRVLTHDPKCRCAGAGRWRLRNTRERALQRVAGWSKTADVFAVPGNVTNKNSWGPNTLIKQGAKLVATWEDVWEDLPAEVKLALAPAASPESGNASGVGHLYSRTKGFRG